MRSRLATTFSVVRAGRPWRSASAHRPGRAPSTARPDRRGAAAGSASRARTRYSRGPPCTMTVASSRIAPASAQFAIHASASPIDDPRTGRRRSVARGDRRAHRRVGERRRARTARARATRSAAASVRGDAVTIAQVPPPSTRAEPPDRAVAIARRQPRVVATVAAAMRVDELDRAGRATARGPVGRRRARARPHRRPARGRSGSDAAARPSSRRARGSPTPAGAPMPPSRRRRRRDASPRAAAPRPCPAPPADGRRASRGSGRRGRR